MPPERSQYQVKVLGFTGLVGDESAHRPLTASKRQLLATLVAAGPSGLSTESAADQLWPVELPSSWEAAFRMACSRLRPELPDDSLQTKHGWSRLDLSPERVDLWMLTGGDHQRCSVDELVELLTSEPYPMVEVTPLIRASIEQFESRRIEVLHDLVDAGTNWSNGALNRLRAVSNQRDWDQPLADIVRRIESTQEPGRGQKTSQSLPRAVPRRLAERRAPVLVGRDAELERAVGLLRRGQSCLVVGPPASGRTSFLAEVASRLAGDDRSATAGPMTDRAAADENHENRRIDHVSPSLVSSHRPFGAFIDAGLLPAAGRRKGGEETENLSERETLQRILAAVDRDGTPSTLVVDDADRLDSHSERALEYLNRRGLSLLISIGGPGTESSEPRGPREAASDGLITRWPSSNVIDLRTLEPQDIIVLVRSMHPDSTSLQQHLLAEEVMAFSHGLAGRARNLIARADAETLTLHPVPVEGGLPKQVEAHLSDAAHTVTAATSVIGGQPDIGRLAQVTGLDVSTVTEAIAELLTHEVLVETTRPDRFELSGEFVPTALNTLVAPEAMQRLHLRMLEAGVDDLARRAWHAESAQPLTSAADAAIAHLDAARAHVEAASSREAVASFRSAERLDPTLLTIADLIEFSVALDRCGADGTRIRRLAFDRAEQADDQATMLRVALSGLPETERLDGDSERIAMIRQVLPGALSRRNRLTRSLGLSRQLLLSGRIPEADAALDDAAAIAASIDEQALAWLHATHIAGWVPRCREDRSLEPAGFGPVDRVEDPVLRARILQATAVSAFIAGEAVRAEQSIHALVTLTRELDDPLRRWHAGLLEALLLEHQLRFEQSDEVADATQAFGLSMGIPGARAARLAQLSRRRSLAGRRGIELESFRSEARDVITSDLARAGFALELHAAGRVDDAFDLARCVVERSTGSRFEVSVAGILTPMVGSDASLAESVRSSLAPRLGTAVVVGAGVSSLGPAEGLMVRVTSDPDVRRSLALRAVELADRWGFPLWRVACRIEHGRAAHEDRWLDEATQIASATGTTLPDGWCAR